MKIVELRIKNYNQFQDIKLDFTNKEGKPVDRICFIGRNGTGKSRILDILNTILSDLLPDYFPFFKYKSTFISIKIKYKR